MSDLINIDNLLRIDTFNTWFTTTNEIIDALNNVNIYDVSEGFGIDLVAGTGDAGEYNGVVTINVDNGPGIQFDSINRTIVGFHLYNEEDLTLGPTSASGPQAAVVNWWDQYIVNDQTSIGATDGTAKAILAGYMLPADVYTDPITFHGDVNIIGNFSVGGSDATIRSNDLRIEDEQIELAYIEKVSFQITGATAGSFVAGQTAHYADLTGYATGASADAIGVISSYSYVSGPTADVTVRGPFVAGGVEDFQIGGFLAVSGGSVEYELVSAPSTTSNFFNDDEYRNPPGIVVKGASGDKSWTWDKDTNAFMSNVNIGTDKGTVYAWRFDSDDAAYGASAGIFEFYTNNITETVSVRLHTDAGTKIGTWAFDKSNNDYALKAKAATGTNNPSVNYGFNIYPGFDTANLGTTYGSNPRNFAEFLNVDMLDGAHGYTTSTPYSIPIALADGKIHPDWLSAVPYVAEDIYQPDHGFATGDCIRLTTTGYFVKAKADTAEHAETVGMVSYIPDEDNFRVTFSGKITDLTNIVNYPLVTGSVYFLSANTEGALISNPDDSLLNGQVRKAMLLTSSVDAGYVLPYLGVIESETTDQVYVSDLVPIGTIIPYSGPSVPNRWLLCNGYMYLQSAYPYLYNVVGKTYYNIPRSFTKTNASVGILYFNNNIGIETGDKLKLDFEDGTVIADEVTVLGAGEVNGVFIVSISKTNAFTNVTSSMIPKVYPSTLSTKFFVPNLSGRFTMGIGRNDTSSTSATYNLAELGGEETVALTVEEIPPHAHTIGETVTVISGSTLSVISESGDENESGYSGGNASDVADGHENLPPYLAVRYIIRAKPDTDAFILTGHNHDLRYIRYDAYHGEPESNDLTEANRDMFRHNAHVSGYAHGHTNADGYSLSGGTHNHHDAYVRHDAEYDLTEQQKSNARENMEVWSRYNGLYRYGFWNVSTNEWDEVGAGGYNSQMYGTLYFADSDDSGYSGYNSGNWAIDLAGNKKIIGVTGIAYSEEGSDDTQNVNFLSSIRFSYESNNQRSQIKDVYQIWFRDDGSIQNLGELFIDDLHADNIYSKSGGGVGTTFHSTIFADTIDFTDGTNKKIRNFTTIDGLGLGSIQNTILGSNIQFNILNSPSGVIQLDTNSVLNFSSVTPLSSGIAHYLNVNFYGSAGEFMTWDYASGNLLISGSSDLVWQSVGGTISQVDTITGWDDEISLGGSTKIVDATGGINDTDVPIVNQVRRVNHVGAAMLFSEGSFESGQFTTTKPWRGIIQDPIEWKNLSGTNNFRRNSWAMLRVDCLTGSSEIDTATYGSSTILHFQFPMGDQNLGEYDFQQTIPSDETQGTVYLSDGGTSILYPNNYDAVHKAPEDGYSTYRIGPDAYLYVDLAPTGPNSEFTELKLAVGTSDGSVSLNSAAIIVKWVVGIGSAYPGVLQDLP